MLWFKEIKVSIITTVRTDSTTTLSCLFKFIYNHSCFDSSLGISQTFRYSNNQVISLKQMLKQNCTPKCLQWQIFYHEKSEGEEGFRKPVWCHTCMNIHNQGQSTLYPLSMITACKEELRLQHKCSHNIFHLNFKYNDNFF